MKLDATYQTWKEYIPLVKLDAELGQQPFADAYKQLFTNAGGNQHGSHLNYEAMIKTYLTLYPQYRAKQCVGELITVLNESIGKDEMKSSIQSQVSKWSDVLSSHQRQHISKFLKAYIDYGVSRQYSDSFDSVIQKSCPKKGLFRDTMLWMLKEMRDYFNDLGSDYQSKEYLDQHKYPVVGLLSEIQNNPERICSDEEQSWINQCFFAINDETPPSSDTTNAYRQLLCMPARLLMPKKYRRNRYIQKNKPSFIGSLQYLRDGCDHPSTDQLKSVAASFRQFTGSRVNWEDMGKKVTKKIADVLNKMPLPSRSTDVQSVFAKLNKIDQQYRLTEQQIAEQEKEKKTHFSQEGKLQHLLVRQVFVALVNYLKNTNKSRKSSCLRLFKTHGVRGKVRAESLVRDIAAAENFDEARSILIDFFNSSPAMRNKSLPRSC